MVGQPHPIQNFLQSLCLCQSPVSAPSRRPALCIHGLVWVETLVLPDRQPLDDVDFLMTTFCCTSLRSFNCCVSLNKEGVLNLVSGGEGGDKGFSSHTCVVGTLCSVSENGVVGGRLRARGVCNDLRARGDDKRQLRQKNKHCVGQQLRDDAMRSGL
jgi:hypothetical protein